VSRKRDVSTDGAGERQAGELMATGAVYAALHAARSLANVTAEIAIDPATGRGVNEIIVRVANLPTAYRLTSTEES
jgi:hypothetical protein